MPGPLSGLRVLDLSRVLAGPWCVQTLGDMGADVIKVERPDAGDDSRHWGPPFLKDGEGNNTGESAYYLSANRNKRSVAIDVAKPAGQQLVRRLAGHADIFVENYKTGGLAKYGLDSGAIRLQNPRIIYCSITGFGQDGPYANRPGYDYLFQGLAGLMSVTGERDDRPGGGPQRVGVPLIDLFTGMYATVAILGALHHRDLSGEGQAIDVSLFDAAMALSSGQLSHYWCGLMPRRTGNASYAIAPYGVFPCADGQMIVASANQSQFVSLCKAIGKPELSSDPRFINNAARMANYEAMHAALSAELRLKPRMEWDEILYRAGVPCGPINDYAQATEHPQAAHRNTRIELEHAVGVPAPGVTSPLRYSATPVEYRRAPPTCGQHTREVLSELLALKADELDHLTADGIIA
ncbi:MAG: CoA transferase [Proteobacteria bacterium]|nr:CoA transferase [Pseudomonadota bacterium]